MFRFLDLMSCLIILPVLLLPACEYYADEADESDESSESCEEVEVSYTLSGNVLFEDYANGPITLSFVEDASSSCGTEAGTFQTMTPGRQLGTMTLTAPGPFEVSLSYIKLKAPLVPSNNFSSSVIILATHNPDGDPTKCEGAAVLLVPQENQTNIQVNMVPQPCPTLE